MMLRASSSSSTVAVCDTCGHQQDVKGVPATSFLLMFAAAVAVGLIVNFSPLAPWKWQLYAVTVAGVAIWKYRWALAQEGHD